MNPKICLSVNIPKIEQLKKLTEEHANLTALLSANLAEMDQLSLEITLELNQMINKGD